MAGMKDRWDRAFATGKPVPLGREVVCDICNADFTESSEVGGFIFGSYGYCPPCARDALPKIQGYGEEDHIRARCPEGQSFADFVRDYRGPDAAIHVRGLKHA